VRPVFHPELVNPASGDPALFVELLFEGRGLLFDLGELRALPPRKILRISDVFVSHAHMDHFMGFDWLLRICLGREKRIRLYGPPGFLDQVGHKLAAYSWNLAKNYASDFRLLVTECMPDGSARRAAFSCRGRFERQHEERLQLHDLTLLDEPGLRVRTAFLDHRIPCLAFALEQKRHVNIWRNRLAELGLEVGPWLRALKQAVLRGDPDDAPVSALLAGGGERRMALGQLRQALRVVDGQKLCYVTDCAFHAENARRIVELASGADFLYIEAMFLEADAAQAAAKAHLTARQAGELARAAGARSVISFHHSARYGGRQDLLVNELESAFRGV
jgi:ribonuclease Z